MKIIDVKIHKVILPIKPDTVHSEGMEDKLRAPDQIAGRSLDFYDFPKWIIELVADNELIGLGESRRGDLYEPLKEFTEWAKMARPPARSNSQTARLSSPTNPAWA